MSADGERFAGLLGAPGPAPVAARLLVRDGVHRGAWMSLRGERFSVGRADDNDIVLTDDGMPAAAGVWLPGADGWQLLDAQGQPLAPAGESRHGPRRLRRFAPHGVTCLLVEHAPVAAAAAARAPAPRRRLLKATLAAVACGLMVGALLGVAQLSAPSPFARMAQALPSLQALQLPDVHLRSTDDGTLALVGFVADAQQLDTLRGWLQRSTVADALLRVQVGTALVGQVRQALDNPADARITYTGGGRVRIDGSTRSAELKRRVQALVADLRGVTAVDDQLAVVDGKDTTPQKRALPIRIVNVMLGDAPYFQTDVGVTYFIGSTLPDGAEVVSIGALQIVFRLEQRELIYRLDI